MSAAVEMICTHCGAEAFLKREPVYEGFKKCGETLSCSACGAVFESESGVRFKEASPAPKIFSEADRPKKVQVFNEDETPRFCRHCAEYVMNPFMQYCSLHRKEIQAVDSCPDFSKAG